MITKKWKFASVVLGVAAFGFLFTMLFLNQTPEPRVQDLPWLAGFLVFVVVSPYCWWRGDQEGE